MIEVFRNPPADEPTEHPSPRVSLGQWLPIRSFRVNVNVIRLMKKSIALILACFVGCIASSQDDGELQSEIATPHAETTSNIDLPSVIAVPRPNSGNYSTEEARALLPRFLGRSIPVPKTAAVVTEWKSPTQGIRIHVTEDDDVEIVDYLGRNLTGTDSIDAALDSTMTRGNERSVLLTSETDGWETPTKKSVVEILFQPSVQIYLIGNHAE